MIGMLTGRVESVETDTALIDVGGVGYEVRMSATDLSRLHAGQDTRVFTYMNLSQDAITLHGFLDQDAKKTFCNSSRSPALDLKWPNRYSPH